MDSPDFPSEHFRLPNGARAMLLPRPRSPTLAIQLLLRAGSRHDGTHPGLAHLVEHLVFRAPTPPRADLYAAVESLGGEVGGGGTTRDYTSFEIVLGAPHAATALSLLAHLAREPAHASSQLPGRAARRLSGKAPYGSEPVPPAPCGTHCSPRSG